MSKSTISTFQLFEMFPDAEAARVYMEGKRWPDGALLFGDRWRKARRMESEGLLRITDAGRSITTPAGRAALQSKETDNG